MLSYGVQGDLHYRFSPLSALALSPPDTHQIAAVAGKLLPLASASLALFAGVGFDVPGFAVKAGIEGQFTLAVIRANLEAGAGLSVQAQEDKRPIPADLDNAAAVRGASAADRARSGAGDGSRL